MFRKRRRPTPDFKIPPPFNPITGDHGRLDNLGINPYCAMVQIAEEDIYDDHVICRGFDPRMQRFVDYAAGNSDKPGISVAKPYGLRGQRHAPLFNVGEIYPAVLPIQSTGTFTSPSPQAVDWRLGQNPGVLEASASDDSGGHPENLTDALEILYDHNEKAINWLLIYQKVCDTCQWWIKTECCEYKILKAAGGPGFDGNAFGAGFDVLDEDDKSFKARMRVDEECCPKKEFCDECLEVEFTVTFVAANTIDITAELFCSNLSLGTVTVVEDYELIPGCYPQEHSFTVDFTTLDPEYCTLDFEISSYYPGLPPRIEYATPTDNFLPCGAASLTTECEEQISVDDIGQKILCKDVPVLAVQECPPDGPWAVIDGENTTGVWGVAKSNIDYGDSGAVRLNACCKNMDVSAKNVIPQCTSIKKGDTLVVTLRRCEDEENLTEEPTGCFWEIISVEPKACPDGTCKCCTYRAYALEPISAGAVGLIYLVELGVGVYSQNWTQCDVEAYELVSDSVSHNCSHFFTTCRCCDDQCECVYDDLYLCIAGVTKAMPPGVEVCFDVTGCCTDLCPDNYELELCLTATREIDATCTDVTWTVSGEYRCENGSTEGITPFGFTLPCATPTCIGGDPEPV